MTEHDDLELKRDLDALPRAIEPPRDFWPAVRARLEPRTGRAVELPVRPGHWQRPGLRIAALLTLLALSAGTLAVRRHNAGSWRVSSAGVSRRFAVGETLATGPLRARMTVGTIGQLDVDSGSNVQLVAAQWSEHRLALSRGTIHAEISAPPRLFIVETPSGMAVDLGCAYTLAVDSAGNSTIRVTSGWVSFEDHGRQSLIPEGMRAITRRGGGIGTPFREDASDSLRAGLLAFDFTHGGDSALALVLRSARARDAVTLWHLVQRTAGAQRERVTARLVLLVPLPADIPRGAVLRADAHAMQLYWTRLPGTLPIVPEWQQKLWLLWLRVFG